MTYPRVLEYLDSFVNYEKISSYPQELIKVERIKEFLNGLGSPQDQIRCIHVAGSKGKGSTCAFIAYMLKEAGYRVGLYTSPHLLDFRERIRILNYPPSAIRHPLNNEFEGMIPIDEIIDLVKNLKPAIDKFNRQSEHGALSFFEVCTALALVYFEQKKVDFAVLETGLGGRLDATNVVKPLLCCITAISYEHTQKLGDTLAKIAAEKAGIIKSANLIVINALQERGAQEVIEQRCSQQGAKLYQLGRDIFYEKVGSGQQGELFNLRTIFGEYPHLKIRLSGQHQVINAVLAVSAVEALRNYEVFIELDDLREGLYNTLWPGRVEVLGKRPFVVLDGAQNVASACALKQTIKEKFNYQKLRIILGISQDKDIKGICEVLFDFADQIILTKADSIRAAEPLLIKKKTINLKRKTELSLSNNIKEALESAYRRAGKEDLILVTGSLFLVADAKKYWQEIKN